MDSDYDDDYYITQASIKAKQSYLREEIIEMEYSAQLFEKFMEDKGGADINIWSFEEL